MDDILPSQLGDKAKFLGIVVFFLGGPFAEEEGRPVVLEDLGKIMMDLGAHEFDALADLKDILAPLHVAGRYIRTLAGVFSGAVVHFAPDNFVDY